MNDLNRNARWCRCIAEELARAGTALVVLCPGSRNSPLLFALAEVFAPAPGERDRRLSHIDERSAAFIALGAAKTSGRPSVVCVTSGSAVANCAPALAEAKAAGVALIVLAADRPWELHGCGAPQTMPQRGAFAAFVDHELALGEPGDDDLALRALRARVSRMAQAGGPALINVPLRDPLPPLPDAAWTPARISPAALAGNAPHPYTTVIGAPAGQPPALPTWLRPGLRGLVVAGPGQVPWAGGLAEAAGFPLLADACSGARRGGPAEVVAFDALLAGALASEQPELIIVCGTLPLTRVAYEYVSRARCPLLMLEPHDDQDFLARADAVIARPDAATVSAITAACAPGDPAWRERWISAGQRAAARLSAAMADEPWSETLAAHLTLTHPLARQGKVQVASSMAVRHANLHAPGPVACNRGLNGIDGTIGTFIGATLAGGGSDGLLLCGDLAFLHDLPALAAARALNRSAVVILNNDGGGIFDYLAVATVPDYRTWVRTPHGMDFAHAAAQFGLGYRRVAERGALVEALDSSREAERLQVIECDLRGMDGVERHRRLLRRLSE